MFLLQRPNKLHELGIDAHCRGVRFCCDCGVDERPDPRFGVVQTQARVIDEACRVTSKHLVGGGETFLGAFAGDAHRSHFAGSQHRGLEAVAGDEAGSQRPKETVPRARRVLCLDRISSDKSWFRPVLEERASPVPKGHEHLLGTFAEDRTRGRLHFSVGRGGHPSERLQLALVRADDVAKGPDLVGQLLGRGCVQHRHHSLLAGDLERGQRRFHWRLQLRQQHVAPPDSTSRLLHVTCSELLQSAGYDDDRILARAFVHDDRRHP
mmetsp:Transcript_31185/g.85490  ORF Transcript_31185/g.85490 Transcript_31185/m.85490 type:complete len:266 (+) Transcript_31185:790-1587(+)